jgi:hypothetical protein
MPMTEPQNIKECKFLIPARLHVLLHKHRVLTGKSISGTVSAALEAYLDELLPDQGITI